MIVAPRWRKQQKNYYHSSIVCQRSDFFFCLFHALALAAQFRRLVACDVHCERGVASTSNGATGRRNKRRASQSQKEKGKNATEMERDEQKARQHHSLFLETCRPRWPPEFGERRSACNRAPSSQASRLRAATPIANFCDCERTHKMHDDDVC